MSTDHPAAAHPAHAGLPALYLAELGVRHDRWELIVTGPDQAVVTAQPIDLDLADTFAVPDREEPGRHLIALSGRPLPVPPTNAAAQQLAAHGYVIDPRATADSATNQGFTQVTDHHWTAPCHPKRPSP